MKKPSSVGRVMAIWPKNSTLATTTMKVSGRAISSAARAISSQRQCARRPHICTAAVIRRPSSDPAMITLNQ
ncbi:hypothetical protein CHU93_03740 [Sandarakinorhabdus cyanobacteriorum]|uniref:Uncharacterized protein n=1 Tax=Sandarakinorhabdus cyanobacteriorum TaxID=1981098 RepID=A0A255YS44_9SPHN|nr:hypothetical protein CHU93_03740 [Sandarakinorhabdus cyanobacteriorum]